MRKSSTLWVVAFIVTLTFALYQRYTGPTYPARGRVQIGQTAFRYRLVRTMDVTADRIVEIRTGDPAIEGRLEWRRHKTQDPWTSVPMGFSEGSLKGELPAFPPTAKLEYRIFLNSAGASTMVPEGEPIVIRFKGHVPLLILIIHIVAMFGGMLVSTRAGVDYFSPGPSNNVLAWWTIGLLAVGGAILGPVVQKYAFDAWWTGWPIGTDLTDNKTAVAVLGWIAAVAIMKRARNPKVWALAAAILLMVIYLIPHSLLGSEMDYSAVAPRPGA